MPFDLISSVTGDGDLLVNKYKSTTTGMTAVVANVDGPLVNGFLAIATEAHDDDGIPHTLEHLVFLGSEDYPYKGVLDLLANRCLASGTNAWTDTDHTCYTMTTAGADGFLNLLPIYLDHVLYPTLTDAGFVTEVHHINENGEDAGVVYCEMQGRENTGESRCNLELLRQLYPGRCGYKSETGGLMKNLRESTTNEKIRAYHAQVYRPENLCVIVTGKVNDQDVLKRLQDYEQKIIKKRAQKPAEGWSRPWQDPVPPLSSSVEKVVEYSCDDENNGLVFVGWRGPNCTTDFETSIAISLLLDYLNDTAASPLQQALVEIDEAYCSSVDQGLIENSESCIYISCESVPKEKLDSVKGKLIDVLSNISNSTTPFDETRMLNVIHRKKLQLLSSMESSPHMAIASSIIGDFLYGSSEHDLTVRLKQVPIIDELANKKSKFWLDLLDKYFLQGNQVTIIGKPSPEVLEKSTTEEKERIKKQIDELGADGLKEKIKLLTESKEKNEIPPPAEMLVSVPVPTTDHIFFHELTRMTNGTSNMNSSNEVIGFKKINDIPFRMQVDNMKTNFITITVLLNTSNVDDKNLRLLMDVWSELVTESAIQRGDTLVPYEEIVNELASDTISSGTQVGVGGKFVQVLGISLKVEESKYVKAIKWLSELLYDTVFLEDRVKVVVKRMLNDYALVKRNGNKVATDLLRSMNFDSKSNFWANGVFRKINFLKDLSKKLESTPDAVISDLNQLRTQITSLDNLTVHVSLNAKNVVEASGTTDLASPWIDVFLPAKLRLSHSGPTTTNKVVQCANLVIKIPETSGMISGVGSVESNFLQQSVESINSFTNPDIAPLLVLMQYLTQLEGPMWREIRGRGLSYHVGINLQISEGLMYFVLFKSTHIVNAYTESLKIIERYTNGTEEFEDALFQSSISSLVFELIEREKTIPRISNESILNYLRGVDMTYTKQLIERVMKVTVDDIKRVAPIYLMPLFDVSKSRCAVCCHPSKVTDVVKGFKEINRQLEVVNLEDTANIVSQF